MAFFKKAWMPYIKKGWKVMTILTLETIIEVTPAYGKDYNLSGWCLTTCALTI